MAPRTMYVVLWAYTAWYAVALAGSLADAEMVMAISPAFAILAGILAGRRPLARRSAT